MPFSYDPEAAGLIPEGVCILTVVAIDETTSSKGDPMWIVRLEDNQQREITEWIVQTPRIIDWKFRPLWEAAGLQWPQAAAIIDEQQLIDRQVQATIKHEESPQFGRTARIDGYVTPGTSDIPDGQEAFATRDLQRVPNDDEPIPF